MDRKEIALILASAGTDHSSQGGARPKHQFGQNFMVDQNILKAIVDAGHIAENDIILEVGPGVGNLTREIARRAPRGAVLAVDIDRHLLPAAQRHHADLKNVTWLLADVLAGKHAIEPQVLQALRDLRAQHGGGGSKDGSELKLVSNLPYNAASPLIAELLVEMWRESVSPRLRRGIEPNAPFNPPQDPPPAPPPAPPLLFSRLTFTVQWEVAQRMNAKPDTRDYGPLGILLQSLASVEILRKIPPGAFWPPPKIHSALVAVTPDPARMKLLPNVPDFQKFLAGIFSHRRQTLGNALKHYYGDAWTPALKDHLTAANFPLSARPETLPIPDLIRLHQESTPPCGMLRGRDP